MWNTQNNCLQKCGVKTSWEILTRKTEKGQEKITVRQMFDWLRGREVEGTGGIRSVAVSDSGGHSSLSELQLTQSRCNETVLQTCKLLAYYASPRTPSTKVTRKEKKSVTSARSPRNTSAQLCDMAQTIVSRQKHNMLSLLHAACLKLLFSDSGDNLGKGKVKVQFTFEQATNAQCGSRYIALPFV